MRALVILVLVLQACTLWADDSAKGESRESWKERKLFGPKDVVHMSGTDIGGGHRSGEIRSEAIWCRGRVSTLRRALRRSRMKLNKTSSHLEASKILVKGLEAALEGEGRKPDIFTHKALLRGLELVSRLDIINEDHNYREHMVHLNVLMKYYKFLIEEVAQKLDMQGYIPYLYSNRDEAEYRNLENRFVRFSRMQIEWVNGELARISENMGEALIVPVGNARSYLVAAELMTLFTGRDLTYSLWEKRFSCAIEDLADLNLSLQRYNQGNIDEFEDDKYAVNIVYFNLDNIIEQLAKVDSCMGQSY